MSDQQESTSDSHERLTDKLREDARLQILAARIYACSADHGWPYVAQLLFSLRIVEVIDGSLDTMAVDDKWRLYYNPKFVMSCTGIETATILLHEAMHCLMDHNRRFQIAYSGQAGSDFAEVPKDIHHRMWNLAGDCAINHVLDREKRKFPVDIPGVRYADFPKAGINASQLTEESYYALMATLSPNLVVIDCGSITGGDARSYELPEDHEKHPGVNGHTQVTIREGVASSIRRLGKNAGNVPEGLVQWALDFAEPQVDWRRQLAVRLRVSVASVAGRRDYSYMRPSRRQAAMNAHGSTIILPAMRQPAPPHIAAVVDTSGSISQDELNSFVGEIGGIMRSVGLSQGLTIVPCDTGAKDIIRVRSTSQLPKVEFRGGGGTDMGAGITAVLGLKRFAHIVIVLTDGYTPWPANCPDPSRHYIAVVTNPDTASNVPQWMRVITIK